MSSKPPFKNRIVGHGEKPASEFRFNDLNWKSHPANQQEALREILSSVGWVTGVIENVQTGNLIDGHGRIEAALKIEPASLIPYTKVDLSPAEEAKILLLLDPIGSMATPDDELIKQLMEIVGVEEESLLGALQAFTDVDLAPLTDDEPNLNDPTFHYQSQYGVIVTCESEQHQEKVYEELSAAGYAVKVVVV